MTKSTLEQALAKEIVRVLRRLRGRVKQIEKGVDLRTVTPETPEKIIYQALLDILPSFAKRPTKEKVTQLCSGKKNPNRA